MFIKCLLHQAEYGPQDVHVLVHRTCAFVTLPGRRNFADVIKLRTRRWGMILDCQGETSVITGSCKRKGEGDATGKEGHVMTEVRGWGDLRKGP